MKSATVPNRLRMRVKLPNNKTVKWINYLFLKGFLPQKSKTHSRELENSTQVAGLQRSTTFSWRLSGSSARTGTRYRSMSRPETFVTLDHIPRSLIRSLKRLSTNKAIFFLALTGRSKCRLVWTNTEVHHITSSFWWSEQRKMRWSKPQPRKWPQQMIRRPGRVLKATPKATFLLPPTRREMEAQRILRTLKSKWTNLNNLRTRRETLNQKKWWKWNSTKHPIIMA